MHEFALCFGCLVPAFVWLTVTPAAASDGATSSNNPENVVVTAEKRSENLQDVSSSVLVASDAVLERTQVRDFDDLVRIAPSLTITKTTQPGNNSINIRGVGTYAYSIATKPSVTVVVDDVPEPFQAEAFQALTDVSQVEVLRGPQSTLFGTSATAGVISITTNAPTQMLSGGAHFFVTNDGEERADGFVSGPISDDLTFRLVAGADNYRGNLYNIYNGDWVNGHNDVDLRAKLNWTPTASWTIELAPHWDNTKSSCCTWAYYAVSPGVTFGKFVGYSAPQAAALNGITPSSNNRRISEDVNPRGNAVDEGGALKIRHTFGGYTLLSITGYSNYDLHDDQDTDGTSFNWGPGGANIPGAIVGGSANGGWFTVDSLTEEIRLTSPSGDAFRYVLGFFFSNTNSGRSYVRGSNTLQQDGTLPTVPPSTSGYASYITHAADTNYALYGQSTYDVADRLSLVTGLRLNHERMSYNLADRFNNVSYGVPDCSMATPSGLKASTCNGFDSLTGKAALEYHIAPAIMVFGSYDRGYKGAAYDLTSTYTTRSPVTAVGPDFGFPTADAVAAKQPIAPETVDAFQLGLKSTWFDQVTWNTTLFDETFHDFQAQSRDLLTNQNILNSIQRVTTRGVETELTANLTPDLTLSLDGAYDEAVMNDFPNASCFPLQTAALGCVNSQQNLSGKTLFDAPKWNLAANGEYDYPLDGGYNIAFASSWHWQSSEYHSLLQDPDSVQKSYGIWNISIGIGRDSWRLTAVCINVLDQNYSLAKGRDSHWNINPYGASPGPVSDAINWEPGRDSERYFGAELSLHY